MHVDGTLLLGGGLAYLLGSIPFGLLLTRCAGLDDLRAIGSGNIGATNVLRTGRKTLAAATFILDAGKGAVAVLVAARFGADMAVVAALCVVLGHIFPIWLKFKGGKGVATAGGVLVAYVPPVGIAAVAVWIAMAAIFRYSSLAALASAASVPVWLWLFAPPGTGPMWVALALAAIVMVRHIGNIGRLLRGTESKIGRSGP
jgi:acyl phosphate:glycerol-3-phosphate acyltransferase